MKRSIVTVMFLTIFTKIIAYSKDLVLAYYYGTSQIVDIFVIAVNVPMLLFTFLGSAISAGYIPRYNSIQNKYGANRANQFTSNLMNILFLVFLFITILILVFTKQFIYIFASGFTGDKLSTAIYFTRISSLSLIISVPVAVLSSFLHMKGKFWIVSLKTVPMNLVLITFIIFGNKDPNLLIYGFVIGTVTQLLVILPSIYKEKFKYSPIVNLKDEDIKKFIILVAPIFLAIAINDINQIVDKTLASNLGDGAISALNYAHKIDTIVKTIFVSSVTIVMFPSISKLGSSKEYKKMNNTIIESLVIISLLMVPATLALIVFSKETVTLLYGRGNFDESSISNTSYALIFYSIGMLGFGFRQALTRVFYAIDRFKIPLYNSFFAAIINIGLNLVFYLYTNMGIGGLALATSISGITSSLFLFIQIKLLNIGFELKQFVKTFIKIVVISIIMIIIGFFLQYQVLSLIQLSSNIIYIFVMFISASTYFILVYVFNVGDTKFLIKKHFLKR